jgi:hypothetical protein
MLLLADATLAVMVAAGGVADASYGRVDGDSALAVSAGAAFDVRGVRGSVDLRYRYLQSVGIFATYEEGFGAGAEPARLVLAGFELRPVFLARWLQGLELLRPRIDMLIDSIAFELGGFVGQPTGQSFGDAAGLSFGIALELPLLPYASGPFIGLHAALRWSREALSAADSTTVDVRAFVVTVSFGWQQVFRSHVVDFADVRVP